MLANDNTKQILIVDRDTAAIEPLRQKLSGAGFVVSVVTDGVAAIAAVAERAPHLLIIDWNIPGFTVLDLMSGIRAARDSQSIRLIIISSSAAEDEAVAALNFGADDYIAKPFSLRETVARVYAVLRARRRDSQPSILACGELLLDRATYRVTARGNLIDLKGIEYRLLQFLMSNPGKTFNRTQLLTKVWGGDTNVDERTVDVNVQRLRKILSLCGYEAYVQTVRGFGYRFGIPTDARARP
ncbi:MAG: winged helix-turn-helix domain-containing protein [Pseudomonadota bacterium]|nr:winged helix-turn-helix domain-containing protein [Pseudomonadota bacterium]